MRANLHVHYSAAKYDEYTATSVAAYDQGMIRRIRLEDSFLRREPRTLIDIGTGTAQLLVKIAALPELAHYQLIGTDYFEDMVEQARDTIARGELGHRIRIEQCDVHDLPYSTDSADLVISRSTIHHWADPARAFREIYRILKPGGVAIIHEPRRDPHPAALEEFNRLRQEMGVEPARMDEKYTPGEAREFLEAAGLRNQYLIAAPRRGPSSLGFEVRISKCHAAKVWVASWMARAACLLGLF
ncbi:MAG: class I SAM-dependent methyltransferase [Planctomycetaceae bacterium]